MIMVTVKIEIGTRGCDSALFRGSERVGENERRHSLSYVRIISCIMHR